MCVVVRHLLLQSTVALLAFSANIANAQAPAPGKPIKLLEPLPGGIPEIAMRVGDPFGVFNAYVNPMFAFGIGVAAGLAVFMVIIGGLEIMLSNGDEGKMGEGRQRILAAIGGLLLLVFSATILHLLNPNFFQLGRL